MTADTETIREALEYGAGFATPEQFRVIQAALAALGRAEERERALTEALNRASLVIEALADRNTLLTDGEWAGVVSFRTAARAALAGSVAGEEQETA